MRADQWGLLDHILVDCILFKETNDGETALSYFYDCVTRFCNLLQHIGLQLHLLHLLLPIQYFFLLCCSCPVSHCNALCSKLSGGISHLVSHCIDCTAAFTLTHPGILCTVLLIMHCTSAWSCRALPWWNLPMDSLSEQGIKHTHPPSPRPVITFPAISFSKHSTLHFQSKSHLNATSLEITPKKISRQYDIIEHLGKLS